MIDRNSDTLTLAGVSNMSQFEAMKTILVGIQIICACVNIWLVTESGSDFDRNIRFEHRI